MQYKTDIDLNSGNFLFSLAHKNKLLNLTVFSLLLLLKNKTKQKNV